MSNDKKIIGNKIITTDDLLEDESYMECPYCGNTLFFADMVEEDLAKMIAEQCVEVECNECPGDYMVYLNHNIEPLRKCRWCNDEGYICEDHFEPVNGHYQTTTTCDCGRR